VRKYEQQANSGNARQQQGRGPSEKPEGCTSVFIGNLSWNIDEDTIRQAFASCGEVCRCRCVRAP
jgi:nucleolin